MIQFSTHPLTHFAYIKMPIFAVTTSGHDMTDCAIKEKVETYFALPPLHGCFNEHRDQVVVVESNDEPIKVCDALITREKKIPLVIYHADCQAAIFFDPVKQIVSCAHSGWRGSNLNIYQKVIDKMVEMGSSVKDILVTISPSLGPEKSEFIHYKTELNPSIWNYQHRPLYFDFWRLSEDQLTAAGIKMEHITLSRVCTHTSPHCFSYRRDKTKKRDATIAMLI